MYKIQGLIRFSVRSLDVKRSKTFFANNCSKLSQRFRAKLKCSRFSTLNISKYDYGDRLIFSSSDSASYTDSFCVEVGIPFVSLSPSSLTHSLTAAPDQARAVATSTTSDPAPMTTASQLCTRDPLPPVVSRSSLAG